jgi:glycerophosphoryl diester phosphodiesterase
MALGVDFVEIDVRRTRDGTYVNYHDETTPARRAINETFYADLRAELGPQTQTVDEAFDLLTAAIRLHIDIKEPGYERDIVGRTLACFDASRFVITAEDESVRRIKAEFPHLQVGLTLGHEMEGAPPWQVARVRLSELFPHRRLERCHADFVAVHAQLARARVLGYCARRRMPAWVWTVDDESWIGRFLRDPRVAVLITNRPDVALRLSRA